MAKSAFLQRFFKATGNVSHICREVGISRQTFYGWVDNDADFKDAIEAEKEGLIDFAESKLFNLINDKNPTAIIFFLKTKAKHRGYVERQEHQHSGELKTDNKLTIEVVSVSDSDEDTGK